MTVEELIKKLKELPKDAAVKVPPDYYDSPYEPQDVMDVVFKDNTVTIVPF